MRVLSSRRVARWLIPGAGLLALITFTGDRVHAQVRREFTVIATKGTFKVAGSDKPEIRVNAGDLVHITFDAQDIPHSFTTVETSPHYRIARRAEPGSPITFDFRADQVGEIPIRCTLTIDPKCQDGNMKLVLIVVEPKER